ncbi:hypothetical protein Aduo_015068 [Ancylostoma duodenale]
MVPESHCNSSKSRESLSDDNLLLGLQSVLRNVKLQPNETTTPLLTPSEVE